MPTFRLAVPDSLLPLVEAAMLSVPVTIVHVPPPADPREQARAQRVWQERRRGRGGSEVEAAAALADASCRSVAAVWDGRADAALVSETDAGWRTVWELIEPKGTGCCADAWFAEGGEAFADGQFLWLEGGADEVASVAQLPLVLVHFDGRREPPASWRKLAATLRARLPLVETWMYSPLLFRDGTLQVQRWWHELRKVVAAGAVPTVCAPRLSREELAAAWRRAGGCWSGALRLGAEAPFARLSPATAPGDVAATLTALTR